MSRRSRVNRDIKIFLANCITRSPVFDDNGEEKERSCEHAPDGNMVWGDPPEAFCHQCIHYQWGHTGHEPPGDDPEEEEE